MNESETLLPFEHFHRYSYVSELVRGKRVLDLAAREGYGARILAESAKSVVGMDPDEIVVEDAAQKHKRDNLAFAAGSILRLPALETKEFDAIVLFDAIESGADPALAMAAIKRLLAPGGLLIISAPHPSSGRSLFPVQTFDPERLYQLVESSFTNVEKLVQRIDSASIIERASGKAENLQTDCAGVQYIMAIASDGIVPQVDASTMPVPTVSRLRNQDKTIRDLLDIKAYLAETVKRQVKEIGSHKRTIASLEEAFAWHTGQIESLDKSREYLEHEIAELRQSMESDRKGLEWRAAQAQELEQAIIARDEGLAWRAAQVKGLEEELQKLEALRIDTENRLIDASLKLARATEELELIHMSTGWKLLMRLRSIRARLLPDGTMRYRLCKRIAKMVIGG